MKTVYLLIHTYDGDILSAQVYLSLGEAEKSFEMVMREEKLAEPEEYLTHSDDAAILDGTFRIAGDNKSCLRLIGRIPKSKS